MTQSSIDTSLQLLQSIRTSTPLVRNVSCKLWLDFSFVYLSVIIRHLMPSSIQDISLFSQNFIATSTHIVYEYTSQVRQLALDTYASSQWLRAFNFFQNWHNRELTSNLHLGTGIIFMTSVISSDITKKCRYILASNLDFRKIHIWTLLYFSLFMSSLGEYITSRQWSSPKCHAYLYSWQPQLWTVQ